MPKGTPLRCLEDLVGQNPHALADKTGAYDKICVCKPGKTVRHAKKSLRFEKDGHQVRISLYVGAAPSCTIANSFPIMPHLSKGIKYRLSLLIPTWWCVTSKNNGISPFVS